MDESSVHDMVDALSAYPVATAYEAAGRRGDLTPDIKPMWPGLRLAGRAVTVRTPPGDMTAVFTAIERASEGDVLVIDACAQCNSTIWGGTTTVAALARGIGGVVANAAVRDLAEIREARFPVYATGSSLRGTTRQQPGSVNEPVVVGGVIVCPGDIVLGDDDGVLIVAAADAEALVRRISAQAALERSREDRLRQGEPIGVVYGVR